MSISVIQDVLRIPTAQDKICQEGIEKPGFPENYTLIGVETIGLSPYRDRITEMDGLKVHHEEVVATFSELAKFPGNNKVPAFITKLNGVDEAAIEEKGLPVQEAIKKYHEFIGNDPTIDYNVNFNLDFVHDLAEKYHLAVSNNDYVDIYRLARSFYPQERHNRLLDCMYRMSIAENQEHRGLDNCLDTRKVSDEFHKLFKQEHTLRAQEAARTLDLTSKWPDTVKQTQAFRSPFIHERVVIAGDLDLDEYELANAVKDLGGFIQEEVGQDTDYVLAGDHDFFRTDVTELNKAKALKKQGQNVRTWSESFFLNVLDSRARS